ncbi:hypothetical protein H0H92_004029 [Tricholoma furcatifolium]|nr:hypothetical protein H0H92_004029 [Tricholoma furcatifolium]
MASHTDAPGPSSQASADPFASLIQALIQGGSVMISYPGIPALRTVTYTPGSAGNDGPTIKVETFEGRGPATAPPAPPAAPLIPEPPIPMDPAAVEAGAYGSDILDVIDERYYVVTVGRRIGVFLTWGSTSPWVTGATGCTFQMIEQGFGARNRAVAAFNTKFKEGNCRVVS